MEKIFSVLCVFFACMQINATGLDPCFGTYSYRSDNTSICFTISYKGLDYLNLQINNRIIDKNKIKYNESGPLGNAYIFELIFEDDENCFNIIRFFCVLNDDDSYLLSTGYYLKGFYRNPLKPPVIITKEPVSFKFEPEEY